MKKTVLAVIIIVLIAGGAWAVKHKSYKAAPATTYSSSSSNQTKANSNQVPASTAAVDIKNMMFTPSQITIKQGTKVTWTNDDNVPHTVTVDKGSGPASTEIPAGETYSYTFNQIGSFQYHCAIHAAMHGTVVVYS